MRGPRYGLKNIEPQLSQGRILCAMQGMRIRKCRRLITTRLVVLANTRRILWRKKLLRASATNAITRTMWPPTCARKGSGTAKLFYSMYTVNNNNSYHRSAKGAGKKQKDKPLHKHMCAQLTKSHLANKCPAALHKDSDFVFSLHPKCKAEKKKLDKEKKMVLSLSSRLRECSIVCCTPC